MDSHHRISISPVSYAGIPAVPVVLQAHHAHYGGTDRWDRWDHHDRFAMEDEVGAHRSHRLVPPLQHQIPWSTTGTTSPTEKLKAEDLGYPHELWIRSMWVTAERVREENSSEGDDTASMTRRSRDIPGTYAQSNI
jgi:hypothetical protein